MSDKLPWYCTIEGCENPKVGNSDKCMTHIQEQSKEIRASNKPEKKKKGIDKVGKKQQWKTTDGTRYTQQHIIEERRRTYDRMDFLNKSPYCQAHGPQCPDWLLDHDHTIAQWRCKQLNKTELIWDESNIVYNCRTAHKQWENYKNGEFRNHKNVEERMAFTKQHDYEGWVKRAEIIGLFNKPSQTI